jgi:hypothetical protein
MRFLFQLAKVCNYCEGVDPGRGTLPPRVRCATLGCDMQPLRGRPRTGDASPLRYATPSG